VDRQFSRSEHSLGNSASELTVIVLTKNEAHNLPRCLSSLPKGAFVIVFDSESTDQTHAIADKFGARFIQRPFDGYATQRNAAASYATTPWILFVDADEELSEDLQQEIIAITQRSKAEGCAAYAFRRHVYFAGRLLRRGKSTDFPIRLFRNGTIQYEGKVHEVPRIVGRTGIIRTGHASHHSYRDLSHYFDKFNHYTSLLAAQNYAKGRRISSVMVWVRFNFEIFYRVVIRLGFLDGYQGVLYATLSSFYVLVKSAKLLEIQTSRHNQ
jgi:glycosyltransferase involved in cell wall biosynthesis